jgi:hypothetical protein
MISGEKLMAAQVDRKARFCRTRNRDASRRLLLTFSVVLLGILSSKGFARDAYSELADLWSLAELRSARTKQVSSTDPLGGNDDHNHFVRTMSEGSYVLADLTGPGVVTRIWVTGSEKNLTSARIRFRFDDRDGPTIDRPVTEFFGGNEFPFLNPLVGDESRSSGGYYCYVPFPYRSRCVIDLHGFELDRVYYNVTYREFEGGASVESFTLPLPDGPAESLKAVLAQWTSPGRDPKAEEPSSVTRRHRMRHLRPGSQHTFFREAGAGQIAAIKIHLQSDLGDAMKDVWIKAYWDGLDEPAIEAPLGLFFCTYGGAGDFRSLLVGRNRQELYCFLPMPFIKGAQLALFNRGEEPVAIPEISVMVTEPRVVRKPLGRLHALYHSDSSTDSWESFPWLKRRSSGHFIGVSTLTRGGSGGFAYLEGDETIRVDGEATPSILGTGMEDYFNAGYYYRHGPFALPLHGCPLREDEGGVTGSYRFHVLDSVPFSSQIEALLEHGSNNTFRGHYESVAFWYEKPGSFLSETVVSLEDVKPTPVVPEPGTNLLKNPGAEEFMKYWTTGGEPASLPAIDPWTHSPEPANRSGHHRFGISIGWATTDCYQYQALPVRPGRPHRARFWAAHQDGTDELAEMTWIDGPWPGEEKPLCRTRPEAEPGWTRHVSDPFIPGATEITIVLRYRHPVASNVASIHVDDLEVEEVPE